MKKLLINQYTFAKLSLPSFQNYNLHPQIIELLNSKQIYTPTPVQDLAFNNKHKNSILIGPTGTGKTLAYLLPMLTYMKR